MKYTDNQKFTLNSGDVIKFLYYDYWSRPVFNLKHNGKNIKLVEVDGRLHTMTTDGEPIAPVKKEFQMKRKETK